MPRFHPAVLVAFAFVLFFACATARPPSEQVNRSLASVRIAKEVGAPSVPAAALHLQLANEQIAKANQLVQEGETQRATFLLQRAEADAQLATSLAKEAPLRQGAERAAAQLKTLRASTGTLAAPHSESPP